MAKFPKDNPTALKAFYGDPAKDEPGRQLVTVKPPFYLWYGEKKVTALSFHKKAAPALERVFQKIWEYYGKDQRLLDKLEITFYSGAYNHRLIAGSKKWSNHAYGAAYDMDAEDNGFGKGRGDIPFPVIAAFKSEGFSWGGDYKGRTDPMHFEACDRGEPVRSFDQWLAHYGCPPMGAKKAEVKAAPTVPKVTETAAAPVAAKPAPAPAKPRALVDPKATVDPKPTVVQQAAAPNATAVDVTVRDTSDRYDMGNTETVVVVPQTVPGEYSIETEIVQRLLDELGYKNVGTIDGKFGGATRGAIASFMNDRKLVGNAEINDQLKNELKLAKQEGFKRPIAEARANATSQQTKQFLPEVKAADTVEKVTKWSAVSTAAAGVVTGVTKSAGEAVSMLDPVKSFLSDVPWPVWVGGTILIALALYMISRKAGEAREAATTAYNEGARV